MASVAIRDVRKRSRHGGDPWRQRINRRRRVRRAGGPSGCGKSTLPRMIAGLENITAGEIRIGGERVVNNLPPKERDVAMVFQNCALYPHATVAANMGFSLKLRGARQPRSTAASSAPPAPRAHAVAATLSAPAFRRPAPARRHGARHRARPAGCSVRRAAVEPRLCPRRHAHRDQGAAPAARPRPSTSPMTRSRP